jgi:hypothetical protein
MVGYMSLDHLRRPRRAGSQRLRPPRRRARRRIRATRALAPRTLAPRREDAREERVRLQARVTSRGAKSFELASLFGHIPPGGGAIVAEIPRRELDYYASRLLGEGTDVVVESPPELVDALREKAREVATLCGKTSNGGLRQLRISGLRAYPSSRLRLDVQSRASSDCRVRRTWTLLLG